MTVARRRSLRAQANQVVEDSKFDYAQASLRVKLCFWCWRAAVLACRATVSATADLAAADMALYQLSAPLTAELVHWMASTSRKLFEFSIVLQDTEC